MNKATQRGKQAIFNPQMYKNRQHPTEAECRLFCCPILPSSCRFCSFLKLLSYRHTAKHPFDQFYTFSRSMIFLISLISNAVAILPKLSVLLYFSILGERPLNIGAIQESCTCESQKSVIRRKVTPNLHTCAAEAQKEREPVSRFPLKKCLLTGRLSGIT